MSAATGARPIDGKTGTFPSSRVKQTGTWRFIDTGKLPSPLNMAVDEALLALFQTRYGPGRSSASTAREPPAISLGRFQTPGDVLDLSRCEAAGVPVVRRITGGGAIYHAEELTYSLVCTPCQVPDAVSVKESFRALTRFICRF